MTRLRAALRLALCLAAAPLALAAHERPAIAAEPVVTVNLSATKVEIDQPFTVELRISTDQAAANASKPELSLPVGMTARGPILGSRSFVSSGPGGTVVERAVTATWTVTAQKIGRFSLQPSLTLGGKALGRVATVEVVAKGTIGPGGGALGPLATGPFAPLGPLGQLGLDDDEPKVPPGTPDPALSLPTAPEEEVFLRVVADKTKAVVGEQVIVTIYQYTASDVTPIERKDASLSDFLRVPLSKSVVDRAVPVMVAGKPWTARVVDKVAAFPLHAGDLHTGKASMRFSGRKVGSRVLRESNDLVVEVREPPKEGRPPGYRLGDVGSFELKADVAPRETSQGGAVSVVVKVTGSGNFPHSLRTPEKTGVEWLDPQKKDAIEIEKDAPTGTRTFGYLVRVQSAGQTDLGAIALSYWDPADKRYHERRIELGKITVLPAAASPGGGAPGAGSAAPGDDGVLSLSKLGAPRPALGAVPEPAAVLPLGSRFLWSVAGAPGLVLLGLGAVRLGQRARARAAKDKAEPRRLAEKALAAARAAARKGARDEALGALDKAVRTAVEAATGLRARGMTVAELERELAEQGLEAERVAELASLLRDAEEARYAPEGGDEARALVDRGVRLVKGILAG